MEYQIDKTMKTGFCDSARVRMRSSNGSGVAGHPSLSHVVAPPKRDDVDTILGTSFGMFVCRWVGSCHTTS